MNGADCDLQSRLGSCRLKPSGLNCPKPRTETGSTNGRSSTEQTSETRSSSSATSTDSVLSCRRQHVIGAEVECAVAGSFDGDNDVQIISGLEVTSDSGWHVYSSIEISIKTSPAGAEPGPPAGAADADAADNEEMILVDRDGSFKFLKMSELTPAERRKYYVAPSRDIGAQPAAVPAETGAATKRTQLQVRQVASSPSCADSDGGRVKSSSVRLSFIHASHHNLVLL